MKLLFIVASHGNENFSVSVFEKLATKLPKEQYNYDWIIGNPNALETNSRYIDCDMNRSAPGDLSSFQYEERRVAEILELSVSYDAVIDIHGTNSDSGVVSIIPKPSLENLAFAAKMKVDNQVIWNSAESKTKGPLTQFVKNIGIGIECGPQNEQTIKDRLEKLVTEIITNNNLTSTDLRTDNFYYVYGKLPGANKNYHDFEEVTVEGESFFPFLTQNKYPDISCYKMRKIKFADLFIEE